MKCFLKIFVLFIVFIGFTGCSDLLGDTNVSTGGVYRTIISRPPETLDPIKVDWPIPYQVMNSIYDTLVRIDVNGEVVPHLARKWEESKDGKEIIFHIRDKVYFHNGRRLTIDDVIYSLNRLLRSDSINKNHLKFVEGYEDAINKNKGLSGIVKIDESTFKIKLKYSFKPFLSMLSSVTFAILPKKELENDTSFFHKPVGSGPFKIATIDDKIIKLVVNKKHFKGRAFLDEVHFNIIKDPNKYKVHFWEGGSENAPLDTSYKVKSPTIDYQSVFISEFRTYIIGFDVTIKPFDNPKVRNAIKHAINLDKVKNKLSNYSNLQSTNNYIPKGMIGYDPDIESPEYNITKAKELLKEAGIHDPKSMGKVKLVLRLPKPAGDALVNEINLAFNKLGIDLEVDSSWKSFSKNNDKERAQMYFSGFAPNFPDPYFLLNYFGSKSGKTVNRSSLNSKKYDELLKQLSVAEDERSKIKIIKKLNRYLVSNTIVIPVYCGSSSNGYFRKYVTGFEFPYVNQPFPLLEKIRLVKK